MISKSIYQPCKKCSKTFDAYSKWGIKSYCSRTCANSRGPRPEKFKQKLSKSFTGIKKNPIAIQKGIDTKIKLGQIKNKITNCVVCGKEKIKSTKTCSRDCFKKLATSNALSQIKHGGGHKGLYHGIMCDSTYELAFLIWHLDHNIPIRRSENVYSYIYKGKVSKYIPDFIANNIEYEIKGYMCNRARAKLEQNSHISVVDRSAIQPYIKWVKSKYNVKNIEDLYEK